MTKMLYTGRFMTLMEAESIIEDTSGFEKVELVLFPYMPVMTWSHEKAVEACINEIITEINEQLEYMADDEPEIERIQVTHRLMSGEKEDGIYIVENDVGAQLGYFQVVSMELPNEE